MMLTPLTAEPEQAAPAHCALCALAKATNESRGGRDDHVVGSLDADVVVAYVDDDAVVLLPTRLSGVLVAPRRHVDGISTLTEHALSNFLAALRRTAESVKAMVGGSGPAIEPYSEIPMTEGHICFRVASESTGPSPSGVSEVQERADRIRRSLEVSSN
jgi:hypothetical protein